MKSVCTYLETVYPLQYGKMPKPTCDDKPVGEILVGESLGICQDHLADFIKEMFSPYNNGGIQIHNIMVRSSKDIKEIFIID